MKKAEYPQRSCRMHVPGQHQDYLCEIFEHHAGPCANASVPHSVTQRDAWEAANPGWEKLSAMDDPFREIKP
jgi:hypothetical protein